jgi:drug/metabolite transporter (DMT)-like permease
MKAVLAMVAAAVLWSTGGLLIKVVTLDGLALATWRSAVAAVTLVALARARGVRVRVPRDVLSWLAVVAYALVMLLFVSATKKTTAANAIFLQYTAPIYVLLLEPLFLGTRLLARDVAFVGLALLGMCLFFVGKMGAGEGVGNALALGSGISLAVFFLLARAKREDEAGRWQAVIFGNLVLSVAVAPYLLLVSGSAALPWSAGDIGGVLFLGVVQIGISYALFGYAISKISALEATLLGMLEPILNPVWVYLGTGERPSPWAFAGAALIVTSVMTRAWLEQRREQGTEESERTKSPAIEGSGAR